MSLPLSGSVGVDRVQQENWSVTCWHTAEICFLLEYKIRHDQMYNNINNILLLIVFIISPKFLAYIIIYVILYVECLFSVCVIFVDCIWCQEGCSVIFNECFISILPFASDTTHSNKPPCLLVGRRRCIEKVRNVLPLLFINTP